MWNFIEPQMGVIITSSVVSVICLIFYHNMIEENGNTNGKSKNLLKWVKVNYTILRKLIKYIWFSIVLSITIFMVCNDYGTDDFIDFSNISRSDILFLVAIVFSFLPLFTNYKIKTPFIDADSGDPEEIVNERERKRKVAELRLEAEIAKETKTELQEDASKNDVKTFGKGSQISKEDVISELKLQREKLFQNSQSEQKGGDVDV